jgi:hypothetical protein
VKHYRVTFDIDSPTGESARCYREVTAPDRDTAIARASRLLTNVLDGKPSVYVTVVRVEEDRS